MKVMMISKALVVGAYHRKLEECAKLGVQIELVIPKKWGDQSPEISIGSGYIVHMLPTIFSGKNHFHFYRGLNSLIQSFLPDILHVDEEPYSIVTYQLMKLAKRLKIRSLFFTWQNIYKCYPFPFSAIEQYNYEIANAAIAGNQEAKNVIQRKGFSKDIFIIPQFGVDPQFFSKQDASSIKRQLFQSTQVQIIGYIGRLVEEKGILTLLEAFAKLEKDTRLLLVGSGSLKRRIIEAANRFGIIGRIVIIDNVPSENVPHYLNCLDCLVLPSLTRPNWKEQFGRVLIEAMACEVPVIGSNSGEIPSVVDNAGLIFREGEASDLKGKLETILVDQRLREELSRRGLERVQEKFTQKHIAEQTLRVYQQIMKR
jgi:glycosyltransferase involved in cell wall biosynthesis